MTGTPPTQQPERWEQPKFGGRPDAAKLPVPMPPSPPGTVEKLAGGLHALVWIGAALLLLFVHTSLVPTVVIAGVAGFVLNHIHGDLRRQRLAGSASAAVAPPEQEENR